MALTFLLLYLLATCDAAFCGFRAAAGRNALLFKRAYYLRAMGRGALWGQLAVAVSVSVPFCPPKPLPAFGAPGILRNNRFFVDVGIMRYCMREVMPIAN